MIEMTSLVILADSNSITVHIVHNIKRSSHALLDSTLHHSNEHNHGIPNDMRTIAI